MATSGNRPFVKRCLEEELGIPNKRLKIDETELFCENRSDKAFKGVGRGVVKRIGKGVVNGVANGIVFVVGTSC